MCKIKVLIFNFVVVAFEKAEVQDASTHQLPQKGPNEKWSRVETYL